MKAAALLAHFVRLSEAPGAVPRLRRFILDLAVRGKLVAQDAGDEPAAELLKRIQVAKARRVKSGELRNPRDLDFPDDEATHFVLPPSWQWVRLADMGAIIGGGTPPSGDSANFTGGGKGIAWLTPADLGKHKGLFISHGARDLTETGIKAGSATLMPKGSVLFTSRAPIGYTAIAENEISTNQGFKSIVPYLSECSRYIAIYLRAFAPWVDSKATGTTFKEVSGKIVSGLPFPLPPLAEQHRIVVKVDELMTLCDQLEAAQKERERRRDRLAAATLQRLNQPSEASSSETQRELLYHFPRLITRSEHIKALRQTFLELAIRGVLLPQDVCEMPATLTALSERLPVIGAEEVPFELPSSWRWTRLGVIAKLFNGDRGKNYPNRVEYVVKGLPFINTGHIEPDGSLSIDSMNYLTRRKFDSLNGGKIEEGDLVYCLRGATMGKTAFVAPFSEGAIASSLVIIRLNRAIIYDRYAYYFLTSPLGRSLIRRFDNGTAQPNLSANSVKLYVVPLPPLLEQHRIVAKVDSLMALCDQLEAQLTTNQTDSRRLLEVVLEAALAPA